MGTVSISWTGGCRGYRTYRVAPTKGDIVFSSKSEVTSYRVIVGDWPIMARF